MSDLIEALQIFLKYGNPHNPTCCQHDILNVAIDNSLVSEDDKKRLKELGFSEDDYGFQSFRYGSC
jgi:hypothetical protein